MRHTLCFLILTSLSLLACQSPAIAAQPHRQLADQRSGLIHMLNTGGDSVCLATGKFVLSPDRQHLSMEARCGAEVRHVRAPRIGGGQPNIFRIPFESAVVSILEVEGEEPIIHLHHQAGDNHHVVTLPMLEGSYSFASLVPTKVKPIPLGKKREAEK